MARPNALTWLPLLDRAISPDVEIGIAVPVTGIPREQFRQYLYNARKASDDPGRYKDLVMFLPAGNHTDEVWICKREVELGEGA